MWHEARRREKATQKLFNDHKKRAGKRREENKVDPSTLLQVQGLKSKINLDPNTHQLAGRSMVVWQGDQKTTIDRFDVRSTLSSIPTDNDRTLSSTSRIPTGRSSAGDEARKRHTVLDAKEIEPMKKLLNYERYRLVIQNDLNRVSEDRRLGMVAKSESLSEAKMRKLEKNYFGTSGEAALSNDQSAMTTSQRGRNSNLNQGNQQSQFKPQGVAIGFTYGQPPSSHPRYDEVDSKPPPSNRDDSTLSGVIDLDDYEELDIDCVDKPLGGSKLIDATLSKYGLNCDELNLLIETADDKTTCLGPKDIVHKLKSLRDKAKQEKVSKTEQVSNFYGPTLPPDMKSNDNKSKPKILNNVDTTHDDDTPIRQRSPRAADLPEKADDRSPSRSPASIKDGKLVTSIGKRTPLWTEQDLEQIPMPPDNPETSPSQPNTPRAVENLRSEISGVKDLSQSERSGTNTETSLKHPEPHVERDASLEPRESRRASTPLAYKRYRRSSRSLSRERSRHRSSSRSSATSSSSSASSNASSSSSSSSSSRTGSSSTSNSTSSGPSVNSPERRRGRRRDGHHKHPRSPARKRRATSRGSTRRQRSRNHRRRRRE